MSEDAGGPDATAADSAGTAGAGGTVERVVETVLPTRHGTFRMIGYRDGGGTAHVALVLGLSTPETAPAADRDEAPLVRVHSECLTGDVLGSRRCDCGEQLDAALARVAREGRGVVVYVRGHEGRGIGILDKLRAYRLQDQGADTVDANLALGHVSDARTYDQSAAILHDLGISRVRLMSSNPEKERALRALGVAVDARVPHGVRPRPENAVYLATKRSRMGHDTVTEDDVWLRLLEGVVPRDGEGDGALDTRYGPLVAAGPRLTIAQLGQSLDGFIAARTGDARFVTGAADRVHLHRLRALVDAVLVGVGTVVADDCRLTVRDVPGPHPVRVLLDPAGRCPGRALLLTEPTAPTLWLVGPSAVLPHQLAPHVEVVRLADDGRADPVQVLALLHARGLGRVLVEGGGQVVSSFVAAGAVNRLFLTTAPILLGDGVPGLRFAGPDRVAEALTGPARRFALGDDLCTELVLSDPAAEVTAAAAG